MRNLVRASVLLLALGLSEPVLAGPLEDARAAYDKQDYTTALRLLRPLAAQGDADAQFHLGVMYQVGQGVPQDYVEAHKWFNLSAARTSVDEEYVREAVKNRNHVAEGMTPAQIAEAQKRASAWRPK